MDIATITGNGIRSAGENASRYIFLTFRLEKLTFRVLICYNSSLVYRIPVTIMVETISAASCSLCTMGLQTGTQMPHS